MRRRSKVGGERVKSQRHKAVTPKRRSAPESVGQETELARRTRERDEAVLLLLVYAVFAITLYLWPPSVQ